jgi:hypothetical protein
MRHALHSRPTIPAGTGADGIFLLPRTRDKQRYVKSLPVIINFDDPSEPVTDVSVGTDPLTQDRYSYINGDPRLSPIQDE